MAPDLRPVAAVDCRRSMRALTRLVGGDRTVAFGVAALVTSQLLFPFQTAWANWIVQPQISAGAEHNSNVRLSSSTQDSAIASIIDAGIEFSRTTESTLVKGAVGGRYTFYSGANDLTQDRDNQSANLRIRHRFNDRWLLLSRVRFRRDDLLRRIDLGPSSLPDTGPVFAGDLSAGLPPADDVTNSDVDLIGTQIRRTIGQGDISAQFRFDERNLLQFGYRYFRREFAIDTDDFIDLPNEASIVGNLNDSERQGLRATYSHVRSETTNVGISLDAFQVKSGAANRETDYYQAALFWTKRLTEATTVDANVGVTRAESDLGSGNGVLLSLRAATRLAGGEFSGRVQRTLFPDSFGEVSERDQITLAYSYRIARNLQAVFEARGERLQRDGDALGGLDTERVNFRPSLVWRLSEAFAVTLNYEYRWIDRNPIDESVEDFGSSDSHRGGLSFTFTPQF